MFLDIENLNVDQLLEKQIEIRKKFSQAQSTGMIGVLDQLQNMLDQISIEIRTKSALQVVDKEREKRIEDGKDPDDDVLNIGEIE
tara:strand:+ start:23 stop:277 length:255 start_codon:yes stop_codon:yes gene_type:complete